jgi:hypothetical protein
LRRLILLQLLLCGLLAVQQPSILVRDGRGLSDQAELNANGAPMGASTEEEEKVPGLRAGTQLRVKAAHGQRWKPQVSPRTARRVLRESAPRCCDTARSHWRVILLPRPSPLDDDPDIAV